MDSTLTVPKTPPALPLPSGARVMGFGHSFIDGADRHVGPITHPTGMYNYMDSYMSWIKALDPRFNVDTFVLTEALPIWERCARGGSNQGRAGDGFHYRDVHVPGTINRMGYVLDRNPDVIVFDIGTNDIEQYSESVSFIQHYDRQLRRLADAGKWVVAMTIAPRSGLATEPVAERIRLDFNDWLVRQPGEDRAGLVVVDTGDLLGRHSSSLETQYFRDGVHLNKRGAYRVAETCLLPVLRRLVSPGRYYDTDPTDGNLMPDAGMLGAAGAKGSGVTGEVATHYRVSRVLGASTMHASKEALDGAFEKQVLTITPVADEALVHRATVYKTLASPLSSLGLAPGDWVQFYLHVEASGWEGWRQLTGALLVGTSTENTFIARSMEYGGSGDNLMPDTAVEGWWITNPFEIPDGADTLRFATAGAIFTLSWYGACPGSGVLKLSRPILRKRANPRGSWNL